MTFRCEDIDIRSHDGHRLVARRIEPEGPARGLVVAGHAMMVDGRTLWRRDRPCLAASLAAAGLRVIVPDLRGHGRSGPLADWTYDDLVADTEAWRNLADLHADGLPVGWLGHSLFGHVSLAWFGQQPQRAPAAFAALAVNVWSPQFETNRAVWAVQRTVMAAATVVATVAGRMPARAFRMGSNDEAKGFWTDMARFGRDGAWAARDGTDYHAGLRQLGCPTLCLVSDADRLYTRPNEGIAFTAPIPNIEVLRLGNSCQIPALRGIVPDHMGLGTDARSQPVWDYVAGWLRGGLAARGSRRVTSALPSRDEPAVTATVAPRIRAPASWLFRDSPRDAWLVAVSLAQAAILATLLALTVMRPGIATGAAFSVVVGVGLWWNANTVAHIHLHRPCFASRGLNRAFSAWLSLLLGVPQVLWRHRHLWHHAGEPMPRAPLRPSLQLALELALVLGSWLTLLALSPWLFLTVYVPGYALGMALCQVQGHFEHRHAGGHAQEGISHYSRFYNWLWFNDGYHVEHHRSPGTHWTLLPAVRPAVTGAPQSSLPPVLRGLLWRLGPLWNRAVAQGLWNRAVAQGLVGLERVALASTPLQRFMVRSHVRAFHRVLSQADLKPAHVVVIGGGLFPRTLMVLREVLPLARVTVIEADAGHVAEARRWLAANDHDATAIEFVTAWFDPAVHTGADLVILPLALVGCVDSLRHGTGCAVVVHAWLWQGGGDATAVVSLALAKRVNLYRGKGPVQELPAQFQERCLLGCKLTDADSPQRPTVAA